MSALRTRPWQVWSLTAAIAALAVALGTGQVSQLPTPVTAGGLPFWALVALFAVTESTVAHLEFRREAHSFSLSEITFTIGLFLVPPPELLAGYLAGSALALGLVRRQRPIKLAFNLATFAAAGSLAAIVFAALGGATTADIGWMATFAAIGVSQLFTTVAIFAVISLSEGEWPLARLRQIVALGVSTALVNTSLGLLIVTVALHDLRETLLLLLPSAMLLVAYRAYTAQRRKHESLGLLLDVSGALGGAPDTDAGIIALLRRTREALRCEHAELLLFASGPDKPALAATVTSDGNRSLEPLADPAAADLVARLVATGSCTLLTRRSSSADARSYLETQRCDDAILAPIRSESSTVGALVVRNRISQATGFSDSDSTLFETLAHHASATLETNRLEKSLARVNELQERLRYQAYHDVLTALPNRLRFTEQVAAVLEQRTSSQPAVLFIDLDDFKAVNDTLGHAAGDELLAHAAARLTRCLRADDLVARLGGDEFAVLLVDADEVTAQRSAERIIAALGRRFALSHGPAQVSASVGIAHATDVDTDTSVLLRNADLALYEAKALGKCRSATFRPVLHLAAIERQRIRDELQQALEQQDFVVHYQPLVELRSGRVVGAEALVRWHRSDGTLSGPDSFIPVAEESGLIVALGRRVLFEACEQAHLWRIRHRRLSLTMSVNVSSRQLQHPRLVDDVREALETSRLDPSALVLEITESTLLLDLDGTLERLRELRELGVRVAIDDFGTGYSSLAYLRRLPVDVLKLDKTFVDDVADSADASALTSGVIRLADSLRVSFVAEGVETAEQRSALAVMGCEVGQGYHFARPMPADDFATFLGTGPRSRARRSSQVRLAERVNAGSLA